MSRIYFIAFAFGAVAITLYILTGVEFVTRYLRDKPVRPRARTAGYRETTSPNGLRTMMGRDETLMLTGLAIATLFLYIR